MRHLHYVLLALLLGAGCGSDDGPGGGGDGTDFPDQYEFGGDRPVLISVPADYDHATPTPLVIVLHGYSASGLVQERYIGFDKLVDELGVLLLSPDGTTDSSGNQFWNATDACCDHGRTGVDDVAYIGGLIDEVRAVYNVDPDRIYLFGHSNGGFMSYRMACERAGDIAAIISLAGATFADAADCTPTEPVNVLQIHGELDSVIGYDGGQTGIGTYPSALGSVQTWATYNGCGGASAQVGEQHNIDGNLPGDETSVERIADCPSGGAAELWTIAGGSHVPTFAPDFYQTAWTWLDAHSK